MPTNPGDARPSRSPVSRRQVLAVGGTGLLAATASASRAAARTRKARAAVGDGTPEQIHLTWGESPTTGIVISWAVFPSTWFEAKNRIFHYFDLVRSEE